MSKLETSSLELSRSGSIGESSAQSEYSEKASSDQCYSDNTLNWNSSSSNINEIDQSFALSLKPMSEDDGSFSSTTNITEKERQKVESFFSGLKTNIFVSSSLVNLYELVCKDEWRLLYTGIPVILHDTGLARSRASPKLTYCLAERGSCFALWRDTIDNLSQYQIAGTSFHTMCLSTDHRKIIGFSFNSNDAANNLFEHIEYLTSDPENISLNVPGSRKKSKLRKSKKIVPLPPKSQISYPCQFHHVNKVLAEDNPRYVSLQKFVVSCKTKK